MYSYTEALHEGRSLAGLLGAIRLTARSPESSLRYDLQVAAPSSKRAGDAREHGKLLDGGKPAEGVRASFGAREHLGCEDDEPNIRTGRTPRVETTNSVFLH